jgi:hypothetical protein
VQQEQPAMSVVRTFFWPKWSIHKLLLVWFDEHNFDMYLEKCETIL